MRLSEFILLSKKKQDKEVKRCLVEINKAGEELRRNGTFIEITDKELKKRLKNRETVIIWKKQGHKTS